MASIRALTPEAKPGLWERSCPRTHKRQRILHIPPPQALEAQGCSQDIKSLDWARPEQREEPEHLASCSGPQGGGTSQGRPPGPTTLSGARLPKDILLPLLTTCLMWNLARATSEAGQGVWPLGSGHYPPCHSLVPTEKGSWPLSLTVTPASEGSSPTIEC